MTTTITFSGATSTTKNNPVHVKAAIVSDVEIKNVEWTCDKPVNFTVTIDKRTLNFTPSADGEYVFTCSVVGTSGILASKTVKVICGSGTTTPPVEPPTSPAPGTLIYDSNVNINWGALTGVLRVDDKYGSIAGNGKGFHMNASGDPRMYLDPATKELKLEHDGSYGRAYFCVTNYNSRLECEFMLDSMSHNFSIKTRNRHQVREEGGQPNATDQQRQGGIGSSYHEDSIEQQVEIWHGNNALDGSKSLSPKLVANKWYKMTYSVQDVNGKVRQINTLDGVTVFQRDISPPSQFFNKAEFDNWSEFWLRLNASNGGWVKIRNVKMYAL